MRRGAALLAAAALGAAASLTLIAGPAGAAGGGPSGQATPSTDGSTLGVRAEVRLSGDVIASAGTGAMTVSVPPACWWESSGMDAEAFIKYWDDSALANHDHSYAFWGMPSHSAAEEAVARQKSGGKQVTWYQYRCRSDIAYEEMLKLNANPTNGFFGVPAIYQPVVAGAPGPAAVVSVADLRDIAQKYMRLLKPTMTRAPGAGLPAIVQLPTWYWADPDDVKTKLVRAEAGPVWAEVRADSLSVEFASPAASPSSVACADQAALVRWADGMSESASSCTLTFPQTTGARGSYTVTATNTWFADWQSSDGGGWRAVPRQPAPLLSQQQLQVAETQVVSGR